MKTLILIVLAAALPVGRTEAQGLRFGVDFGIGHGARAKVELRLPLGDSHARPSVRADTSVRIVRPAPRVELRSGRGHASPTVVAPSPRIVHPRSRRVEVIQRAPAPSGYWRIVQDRRWVAPVYRWERDRCGRLVRVLVCAGRFETVERKVWVPGPAPIHRDRLARS